MNIFGREVNKRYVIWVALHVLIVIDIVLISVAMLFELPKDIALSIQIFDFIVCIILLIEWSITFYISKPKSVFLKQKSNWIDLIASIPFDVLLPVIIPQVSLLRYLRLLKLLRVVALFNRFFHGLNKFLQKSNLDKILGGVVFTVIFFTLLLYLFGPSYGLFDDFYFVIVTLTTVGYGDVTPTTYNEKLITIVLIIVGIFIFSTITAAISSYLTDSLLNKEEKGIEGIIEENVKQINEDLANIKKELETTHKQNEELKQEIVELKKLIKKNQDE